MGYQGEVLTIGALLERSRSEPTGGSSGAVGVRHTAADTAAECAARLASGGSDDECWRFGILQTLDDYTSALRRGGVSLAAAVLDPAPAPTGSLRLDAAFAALADHLAERDGWVPPAWALDPARRTDAWFPAVPEIFRTEAERESPRAFRQRGVFITARSLNRA